MKKVWSTLLSAAALIGVFTFSANAEDKTIVMGTMSWEDLTPITGVTKKVLEDAGYTVKVVPFSEWGIAFAALSKNDVQILAAQTDYAAHDYWTKSNKRLEKISPVSFGLYQGVAVPRYVDIESIDQLNDNAAKFNNRIVGIEPGSGLMNDMVNVVEAYGIKLSLLEGSSAAMTAALKAATERKEWVAVTVWEPSWMAQKYDLKFLKDPKSILPPPQAYHWLGNESFSDQYPHAREIIASVYVPLEAITQMNTQVKDGKTMEEAVSDWTTKHADLLKRWTNVKP